MLHLKNVQQSFVQPGGDRLPVLDIDEFKIDAGEQVVLLGKSGCGKTTLLHVIAGIRVPDRGEVLVAGLDVCKLSEAARDRFRAANVGYVFQTFNLLAGFSALENVLLGMSFGGTRADPIRARQLLNRVGLDGRLGHKPGMLSVGEQQRVAVARALANRPRLMLADEPTANVDARNQQKLIDLIRETCREENVSLLLVTHTPEVSAQFQRVEQLDQFNRAAVTT